ncbi:MAG: hypothetical protein U0835_03630 [Isosphaeraceae bacterium]
MASDNPKLNRESVEHQDQSIKVRKSQLFEPTAAGEPAAPTRPFTEYLRDTPPAPVSPAVKAVLWGVGLVVLLLFLAAFLAVGRR